MARWQQRTSRNFKTYNLIQILPVWETEAAEYGISVAQLYRISEPLSFLTGTQYAATTLQLIN